MQVSIQNDKGGPNSSDSRSCSCDDSSVDDMIIMIMRMITVMIIIT